LSGGHVGATTPWTAATGVVLAACVRAAARPSWPVVAGDGVVEAVCAAPADGEAFLVEQLAYAADEQHFVVLVIAAIAASLDRF